MQASPPGIDGDAALLEAHRQALALREASSGAAVVERLLAHAIAVSKGDAGCIYVLDADRQRLRQAVSRNIPAELTVVELAVGQGVAGAAAASRTSQRIDHYPTHPFAREPFLSHGVQAVIAAPLLCEDSLLGVVNVTSYSAGHRFQTPEVRALELVAFHLSAVMHTEA